MTLIMENIRICETNLMNFVSEHGKMEDQEGVEKSLKKLQLNEDERLMTIVTENQSFVCDMNILQQECDYFKALERFEKDNQSSIELKGEIDHNILKIIYEYLLGGKLKIDLNNFQILLQGCLFLQCSRAEEATISFISQHLSRENAFGVYQFGKAMLCQKLINTSKFYIENVFNHVLSITQCDLEFFLASSETILEKLLKTKSEISEELLFYSIIAWLEYDWSERSKHVHKIPSNIDFRLFSSNGLENLTEETDILEKFDLEKQVKAAIKYQSLRQDRKIKYWNEFDRSKRWPSMIVIGCSGSSHGSVQCCPLSKFSPCPAWKGLTKKPPELKKASTGSSMVYLHPRLYFLGGEQNWYLHWYDLELNRWGVERGVPPARLLSGGCVLGDDLYLVGGVTLDEWEGVKGGAGGVITSCAVDKFSTSAHAWSPCPELDEGRSSPGVIAVDKRIWVFGGLRRREMLTSSCCYNPDTDSWTEISRLPEKIAYFSLVSEGDNIWIIGGLGQDYTCRRTTYKYNIETDEFFRGPDLERRRKGGFSFISDDKIFVCGGSVDGMKYLDTYEVLDLKCQEKWKEHKLNLKNFNSNLVSVAALLPVRFMPT